MTKANEHQPEPKRGSKVVLPYVLQDIKDRAESGKERYSHYLETNNGREAVWDAYQEAIDQVMYMRQLILELEQRGIVVRELVAALRIARDELRPIAEREGWCSYGTPLNDIELVLQRAESLAATQGIGCWFGK